MTGYVKILTLTLPAAVANSIAQSQTPGAAGNLTLNGSLTSGGVATLSPPQRIGITAASGDNTGKTFVITGTGINGLAQSETLVGPGSGVTVDTVKDYSTITSIHISAASVGALTAGTVGIASTAPYIVDRFVNPNNHAAGAVATGTVNYSVEISYDDLSPAWDVNNNPTTWYGASGWTALTDNQHGTIEGPFTMMRLTNNSGTGTSTINVITPFIAGSF